MQIVCQANQLWFYMLENAKNKILAQLDKFKIFNIYIFKIFGSRVDVRKYFILRTLSFLNFFKSLTLTHFFQHHKENIFKRMSIK